MGRPTPGAGIAFGDRSSQHKAAFIGGDTLTLKTSDGASIRLMLYDPEAFVLIMELFEKMNE